jgi:3-deoxy-D-manno-octulosonic-acid transferase
LLYNVFLIPLRAVYPFYALMGRLAGRDPAEFRQRLGHLDIATDSPVWIQASSVGEVGVAAGLIGALRRERPGLGILLTTMTRTGQAQARRLESERVRVAYIPLDFAGSVRRALETVRPPALILVETEIWPNLLAAADRCGVPVVIVNGRISDGSVGRYRFAAPLLRRALGSVRLACVQTDLDARRFKALGVDPDCIRVTGNMKFSLDATVEKQDAASGQDARRARLGLGAGDELWIGGSTAEGEEDAVIAAFEALPPLPGGRRVLLLAPRRPERFEDVASKLASRGGRWARWSRLPKTGPEQTTAPTSAQVSPQPSEIVLLDTMGELAAMYALATVAFVGGSLAPIGGHNVLEPAAQGVAPVFGPNVQNFRDAASRLLEAGAAFQARDAGDLKRIFLELASDPARREEAGAAARRVIQENSGALAKTMQEILPCLPGSGSAAR